MYAGPPPVPFVAIDCNDPTPTSTDVRREERVDLALPGRLLLALLGRRFEWRSGAYGLYLEVGGGTKMLLGVTGCFFGVTGRRALALTDPELGFVLGVTGRRVLRNPFAGVGTLI